MIMKELLNKIVTSSAFYLMLGVMIGGVCYSITSKGIEARDELYNQPYENITKTKSGSNVLKTVEFIDTGKDVQISAVVEDIERNKLWDVRYDKNTKLVYLYRPQQDTYIPYMKDKTTQYTWNIDKEELE